MVYASLDKATFDHSIQTDQLPHELNTHWRFLGFHLVLAMQRFGMTFKSNKGHTIFVFDAQERERVRFTDIIRRPQGWSDEYYRRGKKQEALDHVVDVPYFGDSKEVALIQLADLAAFLLRRYAEVETGMVPAKFAEEEPRLAEWVATLRSMVINPHPYVKKGRLDAEERFWQHAPAPIREL